MNPIHIYPEPRIRKIRMRQASRICEAQINNQHGQDGEEKVESQFPESEVRIPGVDLAIVIAVPEENVLLQWSLGGSVFASPVMEAAYKVSISLGIVFIPVRAINGGCCIAARHPGLFKVVISVIGGGARFRGRAFRRAGGKAHGDGRRSDGFLVVGVGLREGDLSGHGG